MKYSFKNYNKENMVRAIGISLPISFKQSIEICNFIRYKDLGNAKKVLSKVENKEEAIPFKRFNRDLGHKTKIGPGRYPLKASLEISKLLESAEANAQFKGLNTANLFIKQICANKGGKVWHYGRKIRREAKRTNIEVVLEEKPQEKASKVKNYG